MNNINNNKYQLLLSLTDDLFDFEKNTKLIKEISNKSDKYSLYYQNIINKYKGDKNTLFIKIYILISHLYEEYIVDNNKNSGVFYTPFEIVEYMTNDINLSEKINIKGINNIKILDPAVWTWLFVIWLLNFLIKQKYNIKDIFNLLKDNLYIFDIDNNSINLLDKFLQSFFKEIYNLPEFKITNIRNEDYLKSKFNTDIKFDIIIWNPPYWLSSKWYKKEIINKLHDYIKDKNIKFTEKDLPNDIYGLFYINSIILLEDNWIIEFITPNSILNNKTFYWTRKLLLDYIKNIDILNNTFKKKEIWQKAWIDTIIIKLEKKNNINDLIIRNIDFLVNKEDTVDNFLILKENIINKSKLKHIFLLPLSINLDQEILDLLYDVYKNKKHKLIKDYFDSAMGIKTSNNKKYVSNIKTERFNIPFIKGTSKEEQKNKITIYDYINFEQLKKNRPKNSNIPKEPFLDMSIYKFWFPEIWHKWIIRSFLYKSMLVSNSIWIYIPNEKCKNKLWKEDLEKISKIINSKIYEKISKVYSNWIRIEKHIIDNLPLLLDL